LLLNPKHPYTQLLIDSIPQANPKLKWGKLDISETQELLDQPGIGWRDS